MKAGRGLRWWSCGSSVSGGFEAQLWLFCRRVLLLCRALEGFLESILSWPSRASCPDRKTKHLQSSLSSAFTNLTRSEAIWPTHFP